MPVRIVSGKNAVAGNSALLKPLGDQRLIVTGASSARLSGALDDIISMAQERVAYDIFDGIGQNPLISTCLSRCAGKGI